MSLKWKPRTVTYDDGLVRIWLYEEGTEPSDGMGLDFPIPDPLTDESLIDAAHARIRQHVASLPPEAPEESPVTIIGTEQEFEP